MKLFLTSAYSTHPGLDTLLASAALDNNDEHSLCNDPELADVIVFIENTQFDDVMFKSLMANELVQKYSDKVFMYNEMDKPWDVLPGLYTCMPEKHFSPLRQHAFAYLSTPNAYIRNVYRANTDRKWLYSFMGAMSHACRYNIMKLKHEESYMKDTSDFNVWNTTTEELDKRAHEYVDVISSSQYVLCPRGIGTSSIRLYETLESGRAPVIISDDWVAPSEIDWTFAIRVKEKQLHTIPALLDSIKNEAQERGDAAREAWQKHYSPEHLFTTMGHAIQSLQTIRKEASNANKDQQDRNPFQLNKWIASAGLYKRVVVQKIKRQR